MTRALAIALLLSSMSVTGCGSSDSDDTTNQPGEGGGGDAGGGDGNGDGDGGNDGDGSDNEGDGGDGNGGEGGDGGGDGPQSCSRDAQCDDGDLLNGLETCVNEVCTPGTETTAVAFAFVEPVPSPPRAIGSIDDPVVNTNEDCNVDAIQGGTCPGELVCSAESQTLFRGTTSQLVGPVCELPADMVVDFTYPETVDVRIEFQRSDGVWPNGRSGSAGIMTLTEIGGGLSWTLDLPTSNDGVAIYRIPRGSYSVFFSGYIGSRSNGEEFGFDFSNYPVERRQGQLAVRTGGSVTIQFDDQPLTTSLTVDTEAVDTVPSDGTLTFLISSGPTRANWRRGSSESTALSWRLSGGGDWSPRVVSADSSELARGTWQDSSFLSPGPSTTSYVFAPTTIRIDGRFNTSCVSSGIGACEAPSTSGHSVSLTEAFDVVVASATLDESGEFALTTLAPVDPVTLRYNVAPFSNWLAVAALTDSTALIQTIPFVEHTVEYSLEVQGEEQPKILRVFYSQGGQTDLFFTNTESTERTQLFFNVEARGTASGALFPEGRTLAELDFTTERTTVDVSNVVDVTLTNVPGNRVVLIPLLSDGRAEARPSGATNAVSFSGVNNGTLTVPLTPGQYQLGLNLIGDAVSTTSRTITVTDAASQSFDLATVDATITVRLFHEDGSPIPANERGTLLFSSETGQEFDFPASGDTERSASVAALLSSTIVQTCQEGINGCAYNFRRVLFSHAEITAP
ncbi:MAG: hypothetical protein AAFP04_10875 [Myxococcota bacterium]